MDTGFFGFLEGSGVAMSIRNSWLYPIVNTLHIIGIALLVGGIVPLNLRILGLWKAQPLLPIYKILLRTATVGICIAVTFGILLFITRATEYVRSLIFLSKLVALVFGIASTIIVGIAAKPASEDEGRGGRTPPLRARIWAGVSLVMWITTLTLGRLIGYF